jgi:uncharacterized protein (DUF302 family)
VPGYVATLDFINTTGQIAISQSVQCNPLIAITMIRHDITAGLFAPVEVLVTEKESGPGTTIAYVRPSSLMVIEENPPLREAAKALDEKFDALIAKATGA